MKNLAIQSFFVLVAFFSNAQMYQMPAETLPHEGTWLQWPHQFEYGVAYRNSLDPTWVAMTNALVGSEKVHIIVYNATEQTRITNLLTAANVSLTNVDFKIFPTNDVWVRDNGPIFVKDNADNLVIEDWGFNGWGGDYNFNLCNPIPTSVANSIGFTSVDLNSTMTLEGGAFELDGTGVFMATKSSILTQSNSNGALAIRNPGMTQIEAENILSNNLGVSKFIWLDGFLSADDITEAHIDGFAKFANDTTLVTMSNTDLQYWGLSSNDIATLYAASNTANIPYHKVYLPLTLNDVTTTNGNNLGYKGSYCNYYIANTAVLVPNYNDPNDAAANAIIQSLHPGRTVYGIDCRNLYENGGMVHCITQQQPIDSPNAGTIEDKSEFKIEPNFPNPFNETTTINLTLLSEANVKVEIYNNLGQLISKPINSSFLKGKNQLTISAKDLQSGIYNYIISIENQLPISGKITVSK
jgi:agmatine deiminase